jgi:hypothetical protein
MDPVLDVCVREPSHGPPSLPGVGPVTGERWTLHAAADSARNLRSYVRTFRWLIERNSNVSRPLNWTKVASMTADMKWVGNDVNKMFKIGDLLGAGGMCAVHKVNNPNNLHNPNTLINLMTPITLITLITSNQVDDQQLAVKIFSGYHEELEGEIEILKMCRHPNLVLEIDMNMNI